MDRRSKSGKSIGKRTQSRKSVSRKAGKATKAKVQHSASARGLELEIAKLTTELDEALEQQSATAGVLDAISRSAFDLEGILQMVVRTAGRLCKTGPAGIFLREGDAYRYWTGQNTTDVYHEHEKRARIRPGRGLLVGRVALEKKVVHILDALKDPEYEEKEVVRAENLRTMLGVPLMRDGEPIGVFTLARNQVEPFTDTQIRLVSTFASQVVVAVEIARLFDEVQSRTRELQESLQRQTATADVLKVISRSTFDLQTVLDTLTESAARLCNADMAAIARKDEGGFYHATNYNFPIDWVRVADVYRIQPGRGSVIGRALLARKAVQITDVLADPDYTYRDMQKAAGYRSLLGVPLMRGSEPIGVLFLGRLTVRPFTEKQVELVSTFADQAVIAMENVRLFDEVQAKTGDLAESLQQQTATAEVLKVITRSTFNLQAVLDTLVESATRLCDAQDAFIFLPSGGVYRAAARFGFSPEFHKFIEANPIAVDRGSVVGRSVIDRQLVHSSDVLADPEYTRFDAQAIAGYRAVLGAPLVREGNVVGVLFLARTRPGPFTEKQIELVSTFADQAIIAIENTRLLNELQQSLQQQTATAEVLKVISRSTFDLPAVLHALVETAAQLCDADKGTITRQRDGAFFRAESCGFSEDFMNFVRDIPVVVDRHSATGRALLEGVIVHIPDVETDLDYTFHEGQRIGDFRSLLGVPMMREGVPMGVITLTRTEPRPFTDKQIELATTFADQAAIAIQNVRLFDEVQARTRELAKSLEDLRSAQDRLVQTEKLASLGQLTAGIAHEIKNPLNFVNNFAALSAELVDEMSEALDSAGLGAEKREELKEFRQLLKGNLEKVVQHGKRADAIVKNMLLHSRSGSVEQRSVEINSIIEESLSLAYHGARAEKQGFNITLERDFSPAVGFAEVYPQEITRVFLNLISNGFYAATRRAAEAGPSFEPRLKATTRNLGDKVEIRIRDNGPGIPSDVLENIFTPFFTTKPTGEGTGLGLSISHDIVVKQHGGTIQVATEPGAFTEFVVTLPRTIAVQAKTAEQKD
jgi:two-component system, NtrC family, sensor kinase